MNMKNNKYKVSAIIMCLVLLIQLTACGKSEATDVQNTGGDVSGAFGEAINEIRQDDDLGGHIGAAAEKLGGVSFTILDSSTVKAHINSPEILALAVDLSQVQLKLYPDEETRDRNEGAFAFKMDFHEPNKGEITCNVYPQTCRIDQDNGYNTIYDEEIQHPNGGYVTGAAVVEDTMITFVVNHSGLGDIVKNNPYYSVIVDYKEYSRGRIDNVSERVRVVPDLSQTSFAGTADLNYFADVYPEYFVLEFDFDKYMSYSNHAFMQGVGRYEGQIFWAANGNSELTKKALLIGSLDEFGVANYYMAMVYDSHADLMRDYVADGEVNLTAGYGITDIGRAEIKDEMLMGFLPEGSYDMYGSWSYSLAENVLYWHFSSDFDQHYKLSEGFDIPNIKFEYGGFVSGGKLESGIMTAIDEVIDKGSTEGKFDYDYYWDDRSQTAANDTPGTGTVRYKGYRLKDKDASTAEADAAIETDNDKILKEKQKIRKQLDDIAQAETDAILGSDREIDPQVQCYVYDADSADFMLSKLDMEMLTSGGMYEIDCGEYTIRVTAKTEDDPKCVLGRYDGDKFEEVVKEQAYRDLNSGTPNFIHLNVYLGDIEGVTWQQLADSGFSFYEASDINVARTNRTIISDSVLIERYDQ